MSNKIIGNHIPVKVELKVRKHIQLMKGFILVGILTVKAKFPQSFFDNTHH